MNFAFSLIGELLRQILDLIYPPRCAVCEGPLESGAGPADQRDQWICETCRAGFEPVTPPLCPVCGRSFVSRQGAGHWCEDCLRRPPAYVAARAVFFYQGVLREAVLRLKYGKKELLAEGLGVHMADFAAEWPDLPRDAVWMPVPLHPKRLRERGFNQSLLLARPVAQRLGQELDFLSLRRIRYTPPQAGLGRKERQKNVRTAFAVTPPEAVKGRSVVLVDDVSTTGSTLNACAATLNKAGADQVYCLTLAGAAVR